MKTLAIIMVLLCSSVSYGATAAEINANLKKAYTKARNDGKKYALASRRYRKQALALQKTVTAQAATIVKLEKDNVELKGLRIWNVKYVKQNRILTDYAKRLRLFIVQKLGLEALKLIPTTLPLPKPTTQPTTKPKSALQGQGPMEKGIFKTKGKEAALRAVEKGWPTTKPKPKFFGL